jgi:hypothetical protein
MLWVMGTVATIPFFLILKTVTVNTGDMFQTNKRGFILPHYGKIIPGK